VSPSLRLVLATAQACTPQALTVSRSTSVALVFRDTAHALWAACQRAEADGGVFVSEDTDLGRSESIVVDPHVVDLAIEVAS
jgi:hypothetical protein